MPLLLAYRCAACGSKFETLESANGAIGMTRDDDAVGCVCGSTAGEAIVAVPERREDVEHDAGYPYFDRGLDMEITSAAHRARVCRERNLVPLDYVPTDLSPEHKRRVREFNEKADAGERLFKRYDEDPAYAATRIARDRGEILDWNKAYTQREMDEFNRRKA